MRLHEKINSIRNEKGLKQIQLYRRIKEAFGAKAISRRTLVRITSGLNEPTGQSIYQISIGLGVSMRELCADTEEQKSPVQIIQKNKPHGHYDYAHDKTDSQAYTDILCSEQLKNVLTQKLVLSPKNKTRLERGAQPNQDIALNQKWVYVLKGELTCTIDNKHYLLKKGDALHFNSHLEHYFINNGKQLMECLIVQSPREI